LVAGKNDPRRRWRRWLTLHGPAEPLCLPPFPDRCRRLSLMQLIGIADPT
jgi:hypothetical protein